VIVEFESAAAVAVLYAFIKPGTPSFVPP